MLLPLATFGCARTSALDVRQVPSHTTGGTSNSTNTPPVTTPPVYSPPDGDPYSAVPAPPVLSPAALAGIAVDLDDIRGSTSASTGIYIVDAENGQIVYDFDGDVPKTPASNTKLFTSATAFDALGEDHRSLVEAWADAPPDGNGAVDELTILGHHDFTWSSFFYETPNFAAERLADRLWDAGLRRVDGEVTLAGEYLVEGWEIGRAHV